MKTKHLLAAALIGALAFTTSNPAQAADKQPNILYFHVDNSGVGDWGCYGGAYPLGAKTPNVKVIDLEIRRNADLEFMEKAGRWMEDSKAKDQPSSSTSTIPICTSRCCPGKNMSTPRTVLTSRTASR